MEYLPFGKKITEGFFLFISSWLPLILCRPEGREGDKENTIMAKEDFLIKF
jgi:hypothetical protein